MAPGSPRAWQVYIDNLELQVVLPPCEAEQLRGTIPKNPRAVIMADDPFESPGADEKDVLRNLGTVTLGVRRLGDLLFPWTSLRVRGAPF